MSVGSQAGAVGIPTHAIWLQRESTDKSLWFAGEIVCRTVLSKWFRSFFPRRPVKKGQGWIQIIHDMNLLPYIDNGGLKKPGQG